MPNVDPRPLTRLDVLVILVALLVGAAWVWTASPLLIHIAALGPKAGQMGPFPIEVAGDTLYPYPYGYYHGWSMPIPLQDWTMPTLLVLVSLRAASAWLAPLTAAVVALRIRRPRPPLRYLFRQPGTAGCAVASVVLVVELANGLVPAFQRFDLYRSITRCQDNVLSMIWQFPLGPASSAIARTVCSLGEHPGLAVGGAWFALAVSGLWRRGSDRLERLSRVLSMFWLAATLVFLCLPWW